MHTNNVDHYLEVSLVFLSCVRMCSRVMRLVALVCVYVTKNWLVNDLIFVGVIYCSLIEFNSQKRSVLCQAIRSGKEIRKHSINVTREKFPENCTMVSHSSFTCNGASYAMLFKGKSPTCNCHRNIVLRIRCLYP